MIDRDEYLKCKNDIVYFVEKYMKVHTLDDEYVPVKLYPYQKEVLQESLVLAHTSRQIGFSYISKCKMVHSLIFGEYNVDVLVAHWGILSANYIKTILDLYEQCTFPYKSKLIIENKREIRTEDGNMILLTSKLCSIKSYTISSIYVQDYEYIEIKNVDLMHLTAQFNINLGVQRKAKNIWVWSGMNRESDKISELRDKKLFNFKYYKLPYHVNPNFTDERKSYMKDVLSKEQFDIEYALEY